MLSPGKKDSSSGIGSRDRVEGIAMRAGADDGRRSPGAGSLLIPGGHDDVATGPGIIGAPSGHNATSRSGRARNMEKSARGRSPHDGFDLGVVCSIGIQDGSFDRYISAGPLRPYRKDRALRACDQSNPGDVVRRPTHPKWTPPITCSFGPDGHENGSGRTGVVLLYPGRKGVTSSVLHQHRRARSAAPG